MNLVNKTKNSFYDSQKDSSWLLKKGKQLFSFGCLIPFILFLYYFLRINEEMHFLEGYITNIKIKLTDYCFPKDVVPNIFPISSKSNETDFMRDINKCMKNPLNKSYYPTNTEEAKAHYQYLNNYFKQFFQYQRPEYCGCTGPFLENEFIRRFKDRPLSYFSPFIPLFIPWHGILGNISFRRYHIATKKILSKLKPNYLYFIMSESDWGFIPSKYFLRRLPSNVFVFSASGMGHVAIPWLQCEINTTLSNSHEYRYFVSFCGRVKQYPPRQKLLDIVSNYFGKDFYQNETSSWKDIYSKSKFILSPRGIAVATYRAYETLRMGLIPIIFTNKFHWLPYYPNLDWCKFSILTNIKEFPNTAERLKKMSDDEYNEMKNYLHSILHKYFQWDGIFEQVDMFFNSGPHSFTCSFAALNID